MAEFYVSRILYREFHVLYRMTPQALPCIKTIFAVMAGAAGVAFFHLGHAYRLAWSCIIKSGVATSAFIGVYMFFMAEDHRPRFFYFNSDVRNLVTFDALLNIKGFFPVVAGAAGFAIPHIRHVVTDSFFDVENGVMTGLAVIFNSFLPDMVVVIECYFAEMSYLEGDIFYVNPISIRKGNNGDYQDEERITKLHGYLPPEKSNEAKVLVAIYLFPAGPHELEMGKGRVSQRCHVYVDAKEGKERTGNKVMGVNKQSNAPDHDDPFPQGSQIHKQNSADDYEGHKYEHDHQVTKFLDGVELIFHSGGMGILLTEKIVEKIINRLPQDAPPYVIQVRDIQFSQASGYEKIVKYPEKKRNGNYHASRIVEFYCRLVGAEDIDVFRESDL